MFFIARKKFFCREEFQISLSLYIDIDFDLCNPLGTSHKKHKLCGVYWILNNFPPGCSSSLSSIYLAVLCKTEHVKSYGYSTILKHLLHELVTLDSHGVYELGHLLKVQSSLSLQII